jgi:hypothetical protein
MNCSDPGEQQGFHGNFRPLRFRCHSWCGPRDLKTGGTSVCSLSLLIRWAQRACCQAETPLIVLFKFLRPALYGHLAPSFITEAIHSGAPRYGIKPSKRVVPLR